MNELKTLEERIAEKVGNELIDLIPPDQWRSIIDAQVHQFKTVTAPKVIDEMLTERLRKSVESELDEYSFGVGEYNEMVSNQVSDKLKELIAESGGILVAGMLSPAMSIVLQELRNRMNGY